MSLTFVAASIAFTCTPVAVYDGDGPVWCAEGPRLRLSGIAARESDGSCRPGQPCPRASAQAARDALVRMLGRVTGSLPTGHVTIVGPPLRCVSAGDGRYHRTAAWCTLADGRDLSCAMLATGTVLRWDRYWRGHICPRAAR